TYHEEGWLVEAAPADRERLWWRSLDILARIHAQLLRPAVLSRGDRYSGRERSLSRPVDGALGRPASLSTPDSAPAAAFAVRPHPLRDPVRAQDEQQQRGNGPRPDADEDQVGAGGRGALQALLQAGRRHDGVPVRAQLDRIEGGVVGAAGDQQGGEPLAGGAA